MDSVIVPLFMCMGFRAIKKTHDDGKPRLDLVFYKENEFEEREYSGILIKTSKILSSSEKRKNATDLLNRAQQAFSYTFYDNDSKSKNIDRFIIVNSWDISKAAIENFKNRFLELGINKTIQFIDGNKLVDLIDKYMQSFFWNEYDYCNKYFNALKKDFETINDFSAIGQKESVPLENIYVSLRLINSEICKTWEIPNIKERGLSKEKEKILRAEILDVEIAVKEYNKLVILGAPGSGKTTLLRYLTLKYCNENLKKQEKTYIPILITLREISDSEKDLIEFINKVFDKYQFPEAKEFINKDLTEGRYKLLLDGFDELATKDKQDKIAEQIQKFIEKYPKNQIIVTSRVAGYHDELNGFTKLELMEFDDNQIRQFIDSWFGNINAEKAESMFNAIRENEQINALAKNPLMISIIAIIYEEDRRLPQKRAALYDRCVEVLLSKWDVQKRIKNVYSSEKKEFILKKLAFYAHINNKRTITESELIQEMLIHFPRIKMKAEYAKPFIDEIWQRSYLLRQISRDSYDFLHLSFQEYFTALELKEQENGMSTIIKYLFDPWWNEPILLYVGISKDATAFIKRVKKEVPEDIFHNNLLLFGKCIADADFTETTLREEVVNDLWHLYQTAEFSILKKNAIDVLKLIEPENIINLSIKDLNHEDENVQRSAIKTLGIIGSEKVVDPLIEILITSKKKNVRMSAADALGIIRSERAMDSLIKALGDNESEVRASAIDALGSIKNEKAINHIIEALKNDKKSSVRKIAAEVLGKFGNEKVVDSLIKAIITDRNDDVRGAAAVALGNIRSEKAINPLIKVLLTDRSRYVIFMAGFALESIGSKKAMSTLLKAASSNKESEVRKTATISMGFSGNEEFIDQLIGILDKDKEKDFRGGAALALAYIGGKKTIESLIKSLMTDKNYFVRTTSAIALGNIGDEKAIEPLIKALNNDKHNEVRRSAAVALGRIGNEKAIKPLKCALKDEGEHLGEKVKDCAYTSLEEISRRIEKRII